MKNSSTLICTLALCCLQACAGRSIDLDQGAGSYSNGTDAVSIEATQLPSPIYLLDADDARVYWITTSGVQSCVFDHCNATTVSYGPASGPVSLGDESLFFTLNPHDSRLVSGRVVECPKTGCLGRPIELLDDPTAPVLFAAAADAQYFYWSSSTDIYRCPLTGCGEVPEVVAKDETSNGGLIVDGETVFWTFPVDTTDPSGESQIHSAPKDGSRLPKLIANGVGLSPNAVNFTVDATTVYWLDSSSHVQSCPRTGCDGQAPVTLVRTDGAKQTLRVDATGLYWLETADLVGDWFSAQGAVVDHVSLRSCPLSGCANDAEVRVLTPSRVAQFTMSSKYLYWNEHEVYSNGTYGDSKQIFRLAKPQ